MVFMALTRLLVRCYGKAGVVRQGLVRSGLVGSGKARYGEAGMVWENGRTVLVQAGRPFSFRPSAQSVTWADGPARAVAASTSIAHHVPC